MKRATLRLVSPPPVRAEPAAEPVEMELFGAIRRDASDWQEQVFREYYPLVHGLVLKSLGPHADVEDLVSEVFLSFFESARRIRAAKGLRSYIVSITMNAVRREVRRTRRRAFYLGLLRRREEVEKRPSQDNPEAKAALIHLSRILDELGANERSVFVLHSLEGMALSGIAEVLGISHSTAKRRLKRANERVMKRVSRNALLADYIREKTDRHHG